MAVHVIAINKRIASIGADAELICNNPTDTIRFEFDDEWSGHTTKTARFSWENRYIDVVFTGNEVKTPEIFRTNYVFVGVYADNIASTPVKIRCKYSIKCMGGNVIAPAPDVYAQLLTLINDINMLTEDSVLVEYIADETWSEIDSRINAALGVIENGSY